jgi:flavodoxin
MNIKQIEKMKTAIIYTSKHGTTAKVAQMISERLAGSQVSIFENPSGFKVFC